MDLTSVDFYAQTGWENHPQATENNIELILVCPHELERKGGGDTGSTVLRQTLTETVAPEPINCPGLWLK